MKVTADQIESILAWAVEIDSDFERRNFVVQASAGDTDLQCFIEELIENHFHAGGFLEPPAALAATVAEPSSERADMVIGPYKLLEQIGEGGFGTVFMAEQHRPVRRRVALKVIKAGMDTHQVIARFEAERQALALMDHPNIARILDAGTIPLRNADCGLRIEDTSEGAPASPIPQSEIRKPKSEIRNPQSAGRPYFVMELVRGIPITEFCDQRHLTVRQRLELFVTVCQAVQHAHQKGIIHRDLKPSNVLVTLHDGMPVAKVIDFGIAKAIGQQLTDKTLFTNFAQLIGTPMYMSPEQAELAGLDIDTRSDIYSLGVLLYELLTGATPFDRERLRTAGFDEMRRIIREEEPPKPSLRMSALCRVGQEIRRVGQGRAATAGSPSDLSRSGPNCAATAGSPSDPPASTLASISAQRQSEPAKLTKLFCGELDWIVNKAMEKDRNRRYETASAFAADVQRYLGDEPVAASPPSITYRLRKFARRNKTAFAAASALALALLLGVVGLVSSNLLIAAERDAKTTALGEKVDALAEAQASEAREAAERQRAERNTAEAQRQRERAEANFQSARDAVDRLFTRAAEDLRDQPKIRRALLEEALSFYQGFLKERSDDPAVQYETALAYRRVGEIQSFLNDLEKSLQNHQLSTSTLGRLCKQFPSNSDYRDQLARGHYYTAFACFNLVQLQKGTTSMNEAIAIWEGLAKESPNRPSYLEDVARAYAMLCKAWNQNHSMRAYYNGQSHQRIAQLQKMFPHRQVVTTVIRHNFKARADLKEPVRRRFSDLPHDPAELKELQREASEELVRTEKELDRQPNDPQNHQDFAEALRLLGNVFLATDQFRQADELRVRELEIRQRIAKQYSHDTDFKVGLSKAHYRHACFLRLVDRPAEAIDHFRVAIATMQGLVDKYPESLAFQAYLAVALSQCHAKELRDPPRAIDLLKRLTQQESASHRLDELAMAQIAAGRYQEALVSCQNARKRMPYNESVLIAIAESVAHWHLGKPEEARQQIRQMFLGVDSRASVN